jgi:uncharacterized phage-associated protein
MADPSAPPSQLTLGAPALRAAFDAAAWFLDRARADDAHLPLQKLQRLLFIAQAAYAGSPGEGRAADALLMPALFVADELGPIEPNLQRLLSDGRPDDLPVEKPSGPVAAFLEDVWRRFGHMPADRLNALVAKNAAYAAALAAGRGTAIAPTAFAGAFAPTPAKIAEDVRMLRSQSGAPVAVRAWTPGKTAPVKTA